MLSDDLLVQWNQKGLFFGPNETESQFLNRVDRCKDINDAQLQRVADLFKMSPTWIPLEVSSKGLMPWEGAATWIEQTEDAVIAKIQIRPRHSTNDVAAHEMVHVMRASFNEKKFEEILAYQTSSVWWRRYFGPLFLNPTESKVFVGMIAMSTVAPFLEIFFERDLFSDFFYLLPIFAFLLLLLRLIVLQKTFKRCLMNLGRESLAIALHLTDEEIEEFAQSSPEEVARMITRKKEGSLRWRQIALAYS